MHKLYWFLPLSAITVLLVTSVEAQQKTTSARMVRSSPTLTTDTKSTQFSTNPEKIRFLARYLKLPSPITSAEFHIQYHDNSGGLIPGPSDWNIRSAVKINRKDAGKWTVTLQPAKNKTALDWGTALLPKTPIWKITSVPKVFTSADGRVIVAIFVPEGIVLKKVVSE